MPRRIKQYYELTEHNTIQVIIFGTIFIIGIIWVFYFILLPIFENVFKDFLNGIVYNDGQFVNYLADKKSPELKTSKIFAWAIDIKTTEGDTMRYWFNPFLSLFLVASLISLFLAVFITTILPQSIGYIRQKIERVIALEIDKIAFTILNNTSEKNLEDIKNKLLEADFKDIHNLVQEYGFNPEDLKSLHRALIWQNSSFFYKLYHINDAIGAYMRFHFTVRYSNIVLGLVYIGAAVLIIIIGLRGLKFIPPTQPSLVLFALSLEFSLLIIYAITHLYSKEEELAEIRKNENNRPKYEFGTSLEIEKLLKAFLHFHKK